MGRKKRAHATVKFWGDVPISYRVKLETIAKHKQVTRTEAMASMIREAFKAYESRQNDWEKACEANREQTAFVNQYIRDHFGENPADPEQAMSDALDAYYKSNGLEFGPDEESFILPE